MRRWAQSRRETKLADEADVSARAALAQQALENAARLEEAGRLREEATSARRSGDFDRSLLLLEQALEIWTVVAPISSGTASVLTEMATVCHAGADVEARVGYLERAVRI